METLSKARENDLINRGKMYCESGDLQKALTCLNEVIEHNPKSYDAFYIIGNIFHQNGDIEKAVKAFSKVLELEPGHTDAAIGLSVLYNDIGKYKEAQEVFERAHEKVKTTRKNNVEHLLGQSSPVKMSSDPHINKKFAYKHYELADLYMSYGRYDEALIEYNKTVALDPNNLEAGIKSCKVYAKKGFISKALDELRRLKVENPSYYPARVALGVLYFGHGKVIEAQTEWQKTLALDPDNEEAKMYLAMSESATETKLEPIPTLEDTPGSRLGGS
ncbi:MAG: tetratricopeptide repeat protein [Bacteriovoracales bacterium]|nr:tetratricopeptide repeat protein [Bacteriovoracales bacterium]